VCSSGRVPEFQRNILPPSSGENTSVQLRSCTVRPMNLHLRGRSWDFLQLAWSYCRRSCHVQPNMPRPTSHFWLDALSELHATCSPNIQCRKQTGHEGASCGDIEEALQRQVSSVAILSPWNSLIASYQFAGLPCSSTLKMEPLSYF
jgi:hypothetical protein